MKELDPDLLVTPEPDPDHLERIRRRGQRVLAAPGAAPAVRAEAALVAIFSVAMLAWAAAAVVPPG